MLEVRDLSVSYGKHVALDAASVRVGKGEIVVILGANGAGKSSLLKAISGVCEGSVGGSVLVDGIDVTGLSPDRIVEEGIALVPEGRGVFPDLTVQENLTLGAYAKRARDEEAASLERVLTLFPKLAERRRQVVHTMSGGEQQMVAIGRAMMSNPQILALDEPSLGLSPLLCKDLFRSLGTVRGAGLGILLVEQNAKQSLAIADRGYLLENGRIVHEDTAEALMKDPAVQRAYLGGAVAPRTRPAGDAKPAPALLSQQPVQPRPAAQSPSVIAAAAMQQFSRRPTDPTAPTQAPSPKPAAEPASGPAHLPRPVPTTAAAPGKSAPDGIDIANLVARARKTAASTVTPRRPNGPNGAKPSAPQQPNIPMPDLGSGTDRLRAALAEIEEAAKRAQAYRPPNRKP